MLVVMHSHATPEQITRVLAVIKEMKLTPHAMPGATRTAIGITGNVGAVDPRALEVLPGVLELLHPNPRTADTVIPKTAPRTVCLMGPNLLWPKVRGQAPR